MRRTISGLLSLSMAAMLTFTAIDAALPSGDHSTVTVSSKISDDHSREIAGAGPWSQFFNGVACGAGIVAIAGGALSGVGVPAAMIAVTGVAAACVSAFN